MSYTVLRVVEQGVLLRDWHERRFATSSALVLQAFRAFVRTAEPGIYALRAEGDALVVTRRERSSMTDGMPVRFAVSPYADRAGAFPKPPPPNSYESVRTPGIATLLTSPDGRELYESCAAAVVGWSDGHFVLPPADRPRVASVSEAFLREALPHRESPIASDCRHLVLVNAVKGACRIAWPEPFPDGALALLEDAIRRTSSR